MLDFIKITIKSQLALYNATVLAWREKVLLLLLHYSILGGAADLRRQPEGNTKLTMAQYDFARSRPLSSRFKRKKGSKRRNGMNDTAQTAANFPSKYSVLRIYLSSVSRHATIGVAHFGLKYV